MKRAPRKKVINWVELTTLSVISVVFFALTCPVNIFSKTLPSFSISHEQPVRLPLPDSIAVGAELPSGSVVIADSVMTDPQGRLTTVASDTVGVVEPLTLNLPCDDCDEKKDKAYTFNPDPTRAVWMSALFPGLGQLYNRRYWKLPIIIGGYMGLGYATSWNNGMLRDYTRAYSDIMDNDPNTKSYMDFFPPTTREEDLDRTWLANTLQSRKNYYRRNRDLCIICMVGVYFLAMVDAYVDASLSHFDISPDLSMDVAPALIPDTRNKLPGVGLQWALNF